MMDAPERAFHEGAYYQGKVIAQKLVYDADEVPSFVLDIKLEGELNDSRRPASGVRECPQVDVEVRMGFPPEDEARMGYAIKDLQSLGFDNEDLELLNPANKGKKGFFDLTDKVVHLTPKYKTYNDRQNVYWNLRFPKARIERPAAKGEISKSKAAEAYRRVLAAAKADAQKQPF